MCRNIKTLFNFDPPATEEEIRDASLQFVRKLSGFTKPSQANETAFDLAVEEVAAAARKLLSTLTTTAEPRDREEVAAKARAKAIERFGLKDNKNQDQAPVKFHDQAAQLALSKLV
jgi:hypothetical protein